MPYVQETGIGRGKRELCVAYPDWPASRERIEKRRTTVQDKQKAKPTPLKAVRSRCLDCRGFEKTAVRECDLTNCALHPVRMGRGARATLKPIRVCCLWCCNNQRTGVRLCPATGCPLWPYRLGRRPQTTRLLPEIASTAGGFGRGWGKGIRQDGHGG